MRLLTFLSRLRIVLPLALLPLSVPAWASDPSGTLQGIESLAVVVGQIAPDAERDGLTRSELQSDVERHLRQSGITVGAAATYRLRVQLMTYRHPAHRSLYAFSIALELLQPVTLIRYPTLVFNDGVTWRAGSVGLIESTRLREVRSYVLHDVDAFIRAYREQNPKP